MYSFWNTVLFAKADYRGNPFSRHIGLNIDKVHFDRWAALFEEVIRASFSGPKADEAILRAIMMRKIFESKLAVIARSSNNFPIMYVLDVV